MVSADKLKGKDYNTYRKSEPCQIVKNVKGILAENQFTFQSIPDGSLKLILDFKLISLQVVINHKVFGF